ncbi:ABC transporter substrate-binding protein [Schaalia vaccimaxillae]|uniref:ABC transporter substrate-binding protein n=1 Tax=Schaalia vaccimaxillae TaxID=183916 RepID=UPI0003B3F581|nr:extracellular solute-binding protein [Schaalia vaccimaxillae]
MKKFTSAVAVTAALAMTMGMAACSGGSDSEANSAEGKSLTIWDYETDDSAMGKAWAKAIEIFKEEHPGVEVKTEEQTFEQIQKNAKIVLTGDSVPDIMEYNKGNATAGQLASQGLITDLTDTAKERGWDKSLPASISATAQYTEDGLMGSGSWYGVPNYGEFVFVYYNRQMFADAGLEIPKTLDEFIAVMDAFKAKGITPLAEAGAEYPMGQLWYNLVLTGADDEFVRNYQFFDADVDWTADPIASGAKLFKNWVDAGYISADSSGLAAEDMGTSFIAGKYPMMVSGSWWFGRLKTEMGDGFGQFLFPSNYALGSSGNLWVVPENAKNKELAYDFIDITLRPEVQNILGEEGGLPVVGGTDSISDPETKTLTENFQSLAEKDALAYYPDWPVPGFYDQIVSNLQSIMSGSKSPEDAMTTLGKLYSEGKSELTGE